MVKEAGFQYVAEVLAAVPRLIERVEALENRNLYLEKLVVKSWLRRAETKSVLNITDPSLNELANDTEEYKKGKIRRKYEGAKPLYFRDDIEKYLTERKCKKPSDVRERMLSVVG